MMEMDEYRTESRWNVLWEVDVWCGQTRVRAQATREREEKLFAGGSRKGESVFPKRFRGLPGLTRQAQGGCGMTEEGT